MLYFGAALLRRFGSTIKLNQTPENVAEKTIHPSSPLWVWMDGCCLLIPEKMRYGNSNKHFNAQGWAI